MMESLKAYFEGRYAAAEKAAVRAMKLGEKSGLNSIVAARAAHELREFDRRDAYLAEAGNKTVGEETMRLMAKTEFLLDQKQPQSALNSLKELSDTGMHKHIGALSLELKAQQQARNWEAVLDVTAQLEKRNAIDKAVAAQLRQKAWLEKLQRSSDGRCRFASTVEIHPQRIQAPQQNRRRCRAGVLQTGRLPERTAVAGRKPQCALG